MTKQKPPLNDHDRQIFRRSVSGVKRLAQDKIPPTVNNKRIKPNKSSTTEPEETPTISSADKIFYTKKPLPQKVLRKLKKGQYNTDDTIDLHGLTVAAAKRELDNFLAECLQADAFCVLVIHGKGRQQPDQPILKNKVNHWLRHLPFVLAFCSATVNDGGVGAVYVLLEKDCYIG